VLAHGELDDSRGEGYELDALARRVGALEHVLATMLG